MYLGIDIGTSAVKAILIDRAGRPIASVSRALTIQSPHPSWNEQSPGAWWEAVRGACAELAASSPYRSVAAIGLAGQMHGAVCLDKNLAPLRPAILWNDGRSASQCAAMQAEMPEIGQIAGAVPMPGFTGPKLRWLAENEPEIHARIAHILLPKDFVRLRLTGTLVTDMTDAAGTHWLNQSTREWEPALCEVSVTDPAWLPEAMEGTEISGHLTDSAAKALGLPPGIPVAAGGGDAAAGAVGIGAVREGDSFISLGTSGQLFTVTGSYRPKPESAIHAYAHCIPDRWFQMAAMLNGASPIAWWGKASGATISDLMSQAESAKSETWPLFLPYLTGERTPHNNAAIRGAFYGLEASTGRAEMTRAVIDAIAYSFCDARDALASAGSVIEQPAVIGGGARSDLLLQTIADALGTKLKRYEDAETGPAFGAARLAMIAAGASRLEDIATKPKVDKVFSPDPANADRHHRRLERYRALYAALKPLSEG